MRILNAQSRHLVRVTVNGTPMSGEAEPRLLLSDFLRKTLGLTGTHVGCEHGVCGACTVRIDGVAVRACLTLAVQVDGRCVTTVEGLAGDAGAGPGEVLGVLQAAFRRHHALQCGFCTAGILMSAADFLSRVPDPSEAQVRDMLSGHLCRCTGYTGMTAAILDAARELLPHPSTLEHRDV